nr:golgin subfamily A member 6-like protein 2 [Drosophila kikkawai]
MDWRAIDISIECRCNQMKQELISIKCDAQNIICLQSEIDELHNELLKRDIALNAYDCQYEQLMNVICELKQRYGSRRSECVSINPYSVPERSAACPSDVGDDLAFYTGATLDHIMNELCKQADFFIDINQKKNSDDPSINSLEDCMRELGRLRQSLKEKDRQVENLIVENECLCDAVEKKASETLYSEKNCNMQLTCMRDLLKQKDQQLEDLIDENDCLCEAAENGKKKLDDLEYQVQKLDESTRYMEQGIIESIDLIQDIGNIAQENDRLKGEVGSLKDSEVQKLHNQVQELNDGNRYLEKGITESIGIIRDIGDVAQENERLKAQVSNFKDSEAQKLFNDLSKQLQDCREQSQYLQEKNKALGDALQSLGGNPNDIESKITHKSATGSSPSGQPGAGLDKTQGVPSKTGTEQNAPGVEMREALGVGSKPLVGAATKRADESEADSKGASGLTTKGITAEEPVSGPPATGGSAARGPVAGGPAAGGPAGKDPAPGGAAAGGTAAGGPASFGTGAGGPAATGAAPGSATVAEPAAGGPTTGGPAAIGQTAGGQAIGGAGARTPAAGEPVTGKPATRGLVTGEPAAGGPADGGPLAGGTSTAGAAAEKPATGGTATKVSASERPAEGGPTPKGPTAKGPTARGPATGGPVAGGPATKGPAGGDVGESTGQSAGGITEPAGGRDAGGTPSGPAPRAAEKTAATVSEGAARPTGTVKSSGPTVSGPGRTTGQEIKPVTVQDSQSSKGQAALTGAEQTDRTGAVKEATSNEKNIPETSQKGVEPANGLGSKSRPISRLKEGPAAGLTSGVAGKAVPSPSTFQGQKGKIRASTAGFGTEREYGKRPSSKVAKSEKKGFKSKGETGGEHENKGIRASSRCRDDGQFDDFVRHTVQSLSSGDIDGCGLERELRKILDMFVDECGFCFCKCNIPKSRFYAICHKLYHHGLHTLEFKELVYMHKRIYAAAENILPGCLFNMIVKEMTGVSCAPTLLASFNSCPSSVTTALKCCSCKNIMCCDSSEEKLMRKVMRLESDIENAKMCLQNLKTIPSKLSIPRCRLNVYDSSVRDLKMEPVMKLSFK